MALASQRMRPASAGALDVVRGPKGCPCSPALGRRPALSLHKRQCDSRLSQRRCVLASGRQTTAAQGPTAGPGALPSRTLVRHCHAVTRRLIGCRSSAIQISELPAGLRIEAKPEGEGATDSEVEYDEANKVVRIPLSALGPEGRRTKLVLFTCSSPALHLQ